MIDRREIGMSIINNDRLLHWFASVIFGWCLFFAVICIPIFHVWLGIPLDRVAIGTGACCAPQLLFLPLLYSARNTTSRPYGIIGRRIAAVIGFLLLSSLSLFWYIQTQWPHSRAANDNRLIVLFSILGLYALMALCAVVFRKAIRRLAIGIQCGSISEEGQSSES